MAKKEQDTEALQKLVARMVATHPVGRNLVLIGGFRYRFLNNSVRTSDDIDYHWSGELAGKQADLVSFFRRVFLPEVRRLLGYEGSAAPHHGPEAESPVVRIVDLAFWRTGVADSRIEIPVEVTRIVCVDSVTVRTVDGTIYATVSDADMIESKVLAILNRTLLGHRDLVDLFLFRNQLRADSRQRLASKMAALGIRPEQAAKRLGDLRVHETYHVRLTQAVIDSQLDPPAAAQLDDAGGGALVVATVLGLLDELIEVHNEGP